MVVPKPVVSVKRFVLIATVACLVGLAVPAFAAPIVNTPIQPGAPLGWGTPANCTQGFIFRDAAGKWYGSTAAHCVVLNEFVINNLAGDWFGQVVYEDEANDFALFRIFDTKLALVNPAVRHWGGPTGIATAGNVLPNDRVAVSGYPHGFGDGYPVNEPKQNFAQGRLGVAQEMADGKIYFNAPVQPGDSGSPLLLHKNGLALGLTRALKLHSNAFITTAPLATNDGPSIQHATSIAVGAGLQLTLQTAPFFPIPTP